MERFKYADLAPLSMLEKIIRNFAVPVAAAIGLSGCYSGHSINVKCHGSIEECEQKWGYYQQLGELNEKASAVIQSRNAKGYDFEKVDEYEALFRQLVDEVQYFHDNGQTEPAKELADKLSETAKYLSENTNRQINFGLDGSRLEALRNKLKSRK